MIENQKLRRIDSLILIGVRFFRSWDLFGKYPQILEDEIVGEHAKELFADAQKMLKKIVDEKLLTAKAIFGIFPANSNEKDDIELKKMVRKHLRLERFVNNIKNLMAKNIWL